MSDYNNDFEKRKTTSPFAEDNVRSLASINSQLYIAFNIMLKRSQEISDELYYSQLTVQQSRP
jgi:hypothetical protein